MTSRTDPASDGDVVRTIAALARLDIDEREAAALGRQFQSILKQFESLSKLDVTGVEPMVSASGAQSVLRDDVPVPSLPVDVVLANAPARVEDFYRVPKTVGGDE